MANQLAVVKKYMENKDVKKRFDDILKEKSNAFMASIINVTTNSKALQKAEPASIMNAALIAASLDLPIEPNLGYAALVPYSSGYGENRSTKAQFQIMTKGFIQLAIRSGQYTDMDVTEIYQDELKRYNPIKGIVEFNEGIDYEMRAKAEEKDIVGFYAWFKTKEGFEKSLYMPKKNMYEHAKKYSKAYQYDQKEGKKSSPWSTDFISMGKKTAIKLLLSKWGILSVELQKGVIDDQKTYQNDENGKFEDNPLNQSEQEPSNPPANEPGEVIDADFTESDTNTPESTETASKAPNEAETKPESTVKRAF